MLIPNENALDRIEEASSSSSNSCSDAADWLQEKRIASDALGRLSSELNLSTASTECVNLQNSSINIDNSSDVVIGSIAHFHGPVTIFQNPGDAAPPRDGGDKKAAVGKLTKSESVSSEKSCSGDDESTCCLSKQRIILILAVAFLTIATAVSLTVHFTTTAPPIPLEPPDDALGDHRIIYRSEWGGRPPLSTQPLTPPIDYAIISHSVSPFLNDSSKCAAKVRNIQDYHVSLGKPDVGYNFVICGDGNIYVARGWDTRNFHMDNSIEICFIGNYVYDYLTDTMIEAAQMLLKWGLEKQLLDGEYKLVGQNQTNNTMSPGANVYNVIKDWPHFYPGQVG